LNTLRKYRLVWAKIKGGKIHNLTQYSCPKLCKKSTSFAKQSVAVTGKIINLAPPLLLSGSTSDLRINPGDQVLDPIDHFSQALLLNYSFLIHTLNQSNEH